MQFSFAALSLIIFLTGCASELPAPLAEDKKERLMDTLIAQNNFMGIFDHRNELVDVTPGREKHLSRPVRQFILHCCEEKARAIKLLEKNGFIVSPMKDWTTKGYDEAYHGKRLSRPVSFITATQYHVSLYLNNGKVQKVTSSYFSDLKPVKSHSANYKPQRGFNK